MNKNICNFRKFEFIIQVFILICYLLANLFYYRTFHYVSFFALLIICIKNGYFLVKSKRVMLPKELRKEWKIMYPLYVILLVFIIARILWKISFYEISIMSYIAMVINVAFPFVVVVCLLVGEIKQRKLERKEGIQKQYIHLYTAMFQWCILVMFIVLAIKTDKYYATTRTIHYKTSIEKNCISESHGGIFPDTIPKEAENIKFYYSPGGIVDSVYQHQVHLKMKVNTTYLNQLTEFYECMEGGKIKQDCSVLNRNNCLEYLGYQGFEENIKEYFRTNCTLYFFYKENSGYVIDYDNCEVKYFYASGIHP